MSEVWQLILKLFCFLSRQMSPPAPRERQEFSTHLSLFSSPRSYLFMTRRKPAIAGPFSTPLPSTTARRVFPGLPLSQPIALDGKGPRGCGNTPFLTPPCPLSVQSKTSWQGDLARGRKKERQNEGGVELWWVEAGRRRRKSAAPFLLFSFSAETVSGAAPQQQREKSMMNN